MFFKGANKSFLPSLVTFPAPGPEPIPPGEAFITEAFSGGDVFITEAFSGGDILVTE